MPMSPALCPCLNSAQPSTPIIVQLCLLCCLLLTCIPGCSLPFAFLLLHYAQTQGSRNRNSGWMTNKPRGCSQALARTDPSLSQLRKVWSVLLLPSCSLQDIQCQSASNCDVNKSWFSDCEVSAKRGFWGWRSCSPGPARLVSPSGDATQQAPLTGSSTTVLHFENMLKNPLSGSAMISFATYRSSDCSKEQLICHHIKQFTPVL